MPLNAYAESGLDLNRLSAFGFCSNFNVIPKFEIRFYGSEPEAASCGVGSRVASIRYLFKMR